MVRIGVVGNVRSYGIQQNELSFDISQKEISSESVGSCKSLVVLSVGSELKQSNSDSVSESHLLVCLISVVNCVIDQSGKDIVLMGGLGVSGGGSISRDS